MLTCEKCEKIIEQYIVGALPPWSRGAVTKHLDACQTCQSLVETHYRLAAVLEHLPTNPPPDGLWNRIASEISQETPGHGRVPAPPRDWRPSLLVAAAGLTAGVFLGQSLGSYNDAPPTARAMADTTPRIATFVQQHTRMAANDPLADQVSLAAYETTAFRENERMEGKSDGSR